MSKSLLKLFLKLGLSAGMLAFAAALVDWAKFPAALGSANSGWLGAAIAAWIAYQFFNAVLSSSLLEGRKSTWTAWRVNLISTYFGLFLPGDAGAGLASRLRYLGLPDWRHVVMLTLVERLIVFVAMGAGAAVLVGHSGFWPSHGPLIVGASVVVSGGAAVGLWLLASAYPREWVRRFPGGQRFEFLEHLSPKLSIRAFALAIAIAASSGLVAFLLLRAIGSDITYADAFILSFATTVVTLLPISFAGIGVRDLSAIALLGAIGISSETALLSSLFGLFLVVTSAAVGGLLQVDAERRRLT